MPKNVQIRNVDDATYALLRARADAQRLSLTQYLRRELEKLARMPSMADWLEGADRWRAEHGGVDRTAVERVFDDLRLDRP